MNSDCAYILADSGASCPLLAAVEVIVPIGAGPDWVRVPVCGRHADAVHTWVWAQKKRAVNARG